MLCSPMIEMCILQQRMLLQGHATPTPHIAHKGGFNLAGVDIEVNKTISYFHMLSLLQSCLVSGAFLPSK